MFCHTHHTDWQGSVEKVVDKKVDGVDGVRTGKGVEYLEPEYDSSKGLKKKILVKSDLSWELGGITIVRNERGKEQRSNHFNTHHILVEEIEHESSQPTVTPVSMD